MTELDAVDRLIALSAQRVSAYTRKDGTRVKAYTRSVSKMDIFDLADGMLSLDSAVPENPLQRTQNANRRNQIVGEMRKRGKNPAWEMHLSQLLDSPLREDQLADLKGVSSADPHIETRPDGSQRFTRDRQKLHREILDRLLQEGVPQETPRYHMMGGGPASGKSVMEKANPEISKGHVLINPDDIKAELPEYHKKDGTKDAGLAHEESSYLAKVTQSEAFNRSFGVTLDGTGNNRPANLMKKINEARDAGYEVHAYYVSVDTDTAVERAESRGKKTGRFVNPEVIRATHKAVSSTLPVVAPEFDSLKLYDTSTNPATLVVEKKSRNSRLLTHDLKAWQRFLTKAGE